MTGSQEDMSLVLLGAMNEEGRSAHRAKTEQSRAEMENSWVLEAV